MRPETKHVQCFFDQHYHENKENKILWKEQQMNTNIGYELWDLRFLKQPYRVRYQIKAKNKDIIVTFFVLLLFDVRRCQN